MKVIGHWEEMKVIGHQSLVIRKRRKLFVIADFSQ
jgi:hypothetical protein